MDYSQILASQMMRNETWTQNENEFYGSMSFKGFAKMRALHRRLKAILRRALVLGRRDTQILLEAG